MQYIFIPTECDYSGEEEDFKSPAVFENDKIKKAVEKEPEVECTLAIIKPEAVVYRTEIEHRIYTEGFEICQTRWLQLTPEQVSEFYNDHFGELSFPHLVAYMSSGPIVVFVLAKQNAVEEWKKIMGPATVLYRIYRKNRIKCFNFSDGFLVINFVQILFKIYSNIVSGNGSASIFSRQHQGEIRSQRGWF